MNLFCRSPLTRVGVKFGKLFCHAFFYFSDEFCRYKFVTVRLRHFQVCVENEPVLECVPGSVPLSDISRLGHPAYKIKGIQVWIFEHMSCLQEVFWIPKETQE